MAELEQALGIEAKLIEGSGGVFDVTVDDDLIFSKHEQGRFPTNQEIVKLIRGKTA